MQFFLSLSLSSYIERGADKALSRCKKRLAELQADYNKKGGQKKEVEEKKQSLQEELANAKVQVHELIGTCMIIIIIIMLA